MAEIESKIKIALGNVEEEKVMFIWEVFKNLLVCPVEKFSLKDAEVKSKGTYCSHRLSTGALNHILSNIRVL